MGPDVSPGSIVCSALPAAASARKPACRSPRPSRDAIYTQTIVLEGSAEGNRGSLVVRESRIAVVGGTGR